MTIENLTERLRFFFSEYNHDVANGILADTNLIDGNLMDLCMLTKFVIFIEEVIGDEIFLGDFDLKLIASIDAIYDNYFLGK